MKSSGGEALGRELQVSAVIPTYQCGHAVGEAIESVLEQTRPPLELIVVDDGSTDDTAEVVATFGDGVRYLYKANGGCASARNLGIAEARGNWIAFLDSDDLWLPTHLEQVCSVLLANKSLVWASSALAHRKGREGPTTALTPESLVSPFLSPTGQIDDYFAAASAGVNFPMPAMVVHKKVFEEVGEFDSNLACGSDLDMWWRIGYVHPEIGFASTPGAIWRQFRSDSITTSIGMQDYMGMCRLLERHLDLARRSRRLREFRVIASRMMTDLAFRAFYDDKLEVVRYVAGRHRELLLRPYRWPVLCMSTLPFAGRKIVRPLLEFRLWLLGRSRSGSARPLTAS